MQMLKNGMVIAERYEITAKIGAGGMADVYKAMDHKLNRYVAVKVLKPEFREDATFVKKFRSEAQAAAGLTHPNIVSVFDVGDDEGVYYIVMELIEGITLKEYISKRGKLKVKEATSIAIQVCMGLDAAHRHGIVHRDVKPQNIIISTDGKVKVTDFGIARAASSNTISSNVMGSVHYSSPEQVRGGYSDEKSDIYSLGITLYEMVTGKVPFDGDTTVAIAIKHLQEEMVPPRELTPDLPTSLEQIIFKCTQKSVNRRYERMEDVIEDLRHSLIDPNGDFVQLNVVNNQAKTLVFTDKEIGEIKNTPKTIQTENPPNKKTASPANKKKKPQSRSSKPRTTAKNKARTSRSASSTVSARKAQEKKLPVKKKQKKGFSVDLGFLLPMLGLIAGIALLVAVIVVVGRSAGLLRSGENQRSSVEAQTGTSTVQDDRVAVPDLLGHSEEEARSLTENTNIGLQNMGEEPSVYAKGLICRQEIAAGTKVAPHTTIRYYISEGAAEVTVPDVSGMSEINAVNTLQNSGFIVDVKKEYVEADDYGYPLADPGYVYLIEPPVGTQLQVGETITLHVSRGLDYGDSAEVPDVVGMSRDQALTTLGKFLNIQIVEEQRADVAAGEVISQSPEAYSYQDPNNGLIVLTVSSGNDLPQEPVSAAYLEQASLVEEAAAAGEVWKCTQRLNTPSGYGGGLVRLQLLQDVGGQSQSSVVVDSEALTFPYQLNSTGVPGVSEGTLYLYELIDGKYQELGIYSVTFSRVS